MSRQREENIKALKRIRSGIRHKAPHRVITCTAAGSVQSGSAATGAESGKVWYSDGSPRALGQVWHNNRVNPYLVGVNIWIAERVETGELEVVDTNFAENVRNGGIAFAQGVAAPPVTSNFQGLVPGANIQDRRVRAPDPDQDPLTVCIEAGLTPWGYRLKEHLDVSAALPATAGTRWWALVYEDSTGVAISTTGAVETGTPDSDMLLENSGLATVAALENLTIPTSSSPLAGIVLDEGQTAVTTSTRIVDWRLHFGVSGQSGTDADALHVNVANEISTITEKVALAPNDLLVIEDSGASGAKKKVKASNIGTGGGSSGLLEYYLMV